MHVQFGPPDARLCEGGGACACSGRLALFLLAGLEEIDPDFLAIDPSEFAATIGQAGRREQQEKFLERKSHNGSFDGHFGAGFGDIQHAAGTTPLPSIAIIWAS
jgi:hypothetical protein